WNFFAKDFHGGRPALDRRAPGARGLEADEQHYIPGIGETLSQMMQDAASSGHSARRDDNARKMRRIDLFRLFGRGGKRESRPLQRRPVGIDHVPSFLAVLFPVF